MSFFHIDVSYFPYNFFIASLIHIEDHLLIYLAHNPENVTFIWLKEILSYGIVKFFVDSLDSLNSNFIINFLILYLSAKYVKKLYIIVQLKNVHKARL